MMAFDPTTDSWAPGEPPVGDASVLAPDPDKPTGTLSPQTPKSGDFLSDLSARHDKVSGALAGEYGKYTGATSVLDQMEQGRIERDRSRMDQAFAMETAAAHDPALNHPWNADKERSERIKGPLENFGSVGTIFALAASAFTRTPMTSALNAAGAAMTAMRENDEQGYKSAYEAWKSNSDLAIKRFNMERNLYEDANKLVSTDLNLWRQKRASIAAQFDDQKRLIMLENGMDAEVLKADEAFTKAGEQAIDYQKKFEDINLEKDTAKSNFAKWKESHPPPGDDTPQQEKLKYGLEMRAAELQAVMDAKHQIAQAKSVVRTNMNPDQEFAQRWWAENPKGTAEEFGVAFGQYKQGQKAPSTKALSPDQQFAQKWWEEHPDGTAEQFGEAFATMKRNEKIGAGGAGGSTALTSERQHAADIQKIIDDETKSGKLDGNDPKAVAQRRKELEATYGGKPMTGNEKVKLESRIDKFKHSNETIDKTLKVLETHPAAAGIAGKGMRLEERLTNIMGKNDTDRVQLMRDINRLQGWGQELLFGSRGKLKEEAERINSIIAGLSAGDTGYNTVRSLRDIKKLYIQMQKDDQSRLDGTWSGDTPAPAPKSSGKSPWASDPLVGR